MCDRRVFVTLRVVGFHCWPDAPAVVSYLAARHRHVFGIRVEWAVDHEERQVEFHIAQGWIRDALVSAFGMEPMEFGGRSCETIAQLLWDRLEVKPVSVEVNEDGENGAVLSWR